ncbi:MAG: hypothetical protein AMJ46_14585 [Latescibacteria bacterium DG_63]|nr:MAG: hypothetical protein AMJ46_14585 [Latescibacteria bacterium DG_63]
METFANVIPQAVAGVFVLVWFGVMASALVGWAVWMFMLVVLWRGMRAAESMALSLRRMAERGEQSPAEG